MGNDVSSASDRPVGRDRRALPWEIWVVWALLAVVALEILVTYSRLPASELYHVSGSGLAGGVSRALVFVNWPAALVAIPVLVILAQVLPGRVPKLVALAGIALCAVVFWPGVVAESNLDAKPVNIPAALGVAVALVLTVFAARRPASLARPALGARSLRLVVAFGALALSVPWIAADLGFGLAGVPVLGSVYQTGELRSQPGVDGLHPAVHLGHHHGMSGVLFVLAAMLLWRVLPVVEREWLRSGVRAYLALMACYGAGNVANDFWLEQVVKRGWAAWEIPNVTTPKVSVAWALIVAGAAAIWAISGRSERRPNLDSASAASEPA